MSLVQLGQYSTLLFLINLGTLATVGGVQVRPAPSLSLSLSLHAESSKMHPSCGVVVRAGRTRALEPGSRIHRTMPTAAAAPNQGAPPLADRSPSPPGYFRLQLAPVAAVDRASIYPTGHRHVGYSQCAQQ